MKKIIYLIKPSLIFITAVGIQGCNSCSNSNNPKSAVSPENYISMPINSNICYSARFFSQESLEIESSYGNSQFCVPYLLRNKSDVLESAEVESIVHYYYGENSTLYSSCPAIAHASGLPFPESSQYSKEMQAIELRATDCVTLELSTQKIKNPMFVFDIDDTLTSGYIADCQDGFAKYQPQVWQQAKESNAFTRTPQMEKLLKYAFTHDVSVAMVTGRPISQYTMTIQNVITAYPEFESNINQLVSQGNLMLVPTDKEQWTMDSFKNVARQELIKKGYTIILNMGDQYSDLDYIYPYVNPPKCSYKLPNYMYYIK